MEAAVSISQGEETESRSIPGVDALRSAPRFDLCVIDEAHEIFAAIYKRFDRWGDYALHAPPMPLASDPTH